MSSIQAARRLRQTSFVLAATLLPAAAPAQTATPAAVVARRGEVVRIRTAQWEYTGTLGRSERDTAVLHLASDSVRIARRDIVRTRVQRGTRRSTGRVLAFAAGGGAAGFLAGGVLGAAAGAGVSDDGLATIGGTLVGVSLGTLAGGIAGAVWGSQKRYPNWVEAVLDP